MIGRNSLFGPLDPAPDAGYDDPPARKGFFTDTSVCIGCKACEVACKEWNDVPENAFEMLGTSYDNSHSLNAYQWRHGAFAEKPAKQVWHLECQEERTGYPAHFHEPGVYHLAHHAEDTANHGGGGKGAGRFQHLRHSRRYSDRPNAPTQGTE